VAQNEYYDDLETRDPQQRERDQFAGLRRLVSEAYDGSPYLQQILAKDDIPGLTDRAALAELPVLRKEHLVDRQAAAPPFGGLLARERLPRGGYVFASPGPIFEPAAGGGDPFRFARAMWAAGVRPGSLVLVTFAYHLVPAGMMFDAGARAIGATVIPGGTGNTAQQLQAVARLQPDVYSGTPSFLLRLIERAGELDLSIDSLRTAVVAAEPLDADTRGRLAQHGIAAWDCYGTADCGLIAYKSVIDEPLIIDEHAIVEICDPDTGRPVRDGEIGEVVVTILNPVYPLLRFAIGDLSALVPGRSPCGRTNQRLRGWLGRSDQSVKVRGLFVHASQVQGLLHALPGVSRVRLVVERGPCGDVMTLLCETCAEAGGLEAEAVQRLRERTGLRGDVSLVEPGGLPDDGRWIEDRRR